MWGCNSTIFKELERNPERSTRSMRWAYRAPGEPNLTAILEAHGHLIAVGEQGTILLSQDGGRSWDRHVIDTHPLRSLARKDSTTMVVGGEGTILMSDDFGATWHRGESPVVSDLSSVATSNNSFWIAGSGGVLMKSHSGNHWTSVKIPSLGADLTATAVSRDDKIILTATSRGLIFRSDDGGSTWKETTTNLTSSIFCITFVNDTAIATTENGILLRSDNQGMTWDKVDTGMTNNLAGIAFSSSLHTWWISGDNGVFLASTDEGHHWSRVIFDGNRALRGIWTDAEGQVVVVGTGGIVLKRRTDGSFATLRGDKYYAEGILYNSRYKTLVAYGQGGTVLSSHDNGRSWLQQTLSRDVVLRAGASSVFGTWLVL